MPRATPPSFRLALISMPWPLFNRPSIQLGALKAYLGQQPWLQVETLHPFLAVAKRIGVTRYQWISRNVWVCEALYSGLLFPEQREKTHRFLRQAMRTAPREARFDIVETQAILGEELQRFREQGEWHRFQLIGFSVCFNQLAASLAGARAIKEIAPQVPVVFGGSTCAPSVARSLLEAFPEIDYAVIGEGEQPLLGLCEHLAGVGPLPPQALTATPRIATAPTPCDTYAQLPHLDQLPVPDYDDYLQDMRRHFGDEPFIPELPVEFSRGCWWGKCAFCNLNLQWHGYRTKSAGRMLAEVQALGKRHQSLDFTFTDNALPVRGSVEFFSRLAEERHDYRFFGEIRVSQRGEQLAACRRGGLVAVQAGFEALSNGLLQRINKGVTVIDNLALMKDAVACGITADGNLITEFPGSTDAEAEETLHNLDFALPFTPLSVAAFFLGMGSPADRAPARFGIRAVTHHPTNQKLFPAPLLARLDLLIKGYRGDRTEQRRRWRPVARKIKAWQDFHHHRAGSIFEKPPLSYRDGGDFLIIRQEQAGGKTLHHRLKGLSREIYLFCEEIRTDSELFHRFPQLAEKKLLTFLQDLMKKRILFIDGNRFLALAVRRG